MILLSIDNRIIKGDVMKKLLMVIIACTLAATAHASNSTIGLSGQEQVDLIGQPTTAPQLRPNDKNFRVGEFVAIDTIDAQPEHLRTEKEYELQADGTLRKVTDFSSGEYEIARYDGPTGDGSHIISIRDKNTAFGGRPGMIIQKSIPAHLIYKM